MSTRPLSAPQDVEIMALRLAGVFVEDWPQRLLGRDLLAFCLSKTFIFVPPSQSAYVGVPDCLIWTDSRPAFVPQTASQYASSVNFEGRIVRAQH
jgi:hypothetical protein